MGIVVLTLGSGKNEYYIFGPDTSTIHPEEFSHRDDIVTVVIPVGVTEIGERAFSHCSSLKTITFLGEVTKIGEQAFSYCSSLKAISFPRGLKTIERFAFDCCRSLKAIAFPDGLTEIGHRAFVCSALDTVTLPATVTELGVKVFDRDVIVNRSTNTSKV